MFMTKDPEYLTIPQAAKAAGVSRTIIERWIATGKLRRFQRAGGSYTLVRRDELDSAARIVPEDEPHTP